MSSDEAWVLEGDLIAVGGQPPEATLSLVVDDAICKCTLPLGRVEAQRLARHLYKDVRVTLEVKEAGR